MEPSALATAAVTLLQPYLRFLGTVGNEPAPTPSQQLSRRLHQRIRARFEPGSYEGALLAGVEQRPDSERRLSALQAALADVIEEDPAFAASLASLLQDVAADGRVGHGLDIGVGSVSGNVTVRGKYAAGRDITAGPIEREKPLGALAAD